MFRPARALTSILVLFALGVPAATVPAPAAEPSAPSPSANVFAVETGEIAGAAFSLALPSRWNRCLLLLAPGARPSDRQPAAEVVTDQPARRTLLEAGWIIAATRYRRGGLIIAEALADVDALRAHIAERFGTPELVLVEGEAMGGLIVTHLAEREPLQPTLYHGAVAIGAELHLREPNSPLGGLTLQPRIPLVFLATRTELDGPRHYVAADVPRLGAHVPVLLRVSRDGQANVNQAERLAALRVLFRWIENGRSTVPAPLPGSELVDVTVPPWPRPSRVVPHPDGRGFDARATAVHPTRGMIVLDAQPADLDAAGIAPRTWFQLAVGSTRFRVFHGRDLTGVKRGEWVAFADADGHVTVARHFADAAATARIQVGDTVSLRRFPPAGGP
jgi:hypothetical protein